MAGRRPDCARKKHGRRMASVVGATLVFGFAGGFIADARAERIANPIAAFAGLDKITGITTSFEIPIGEQRQFGGLIVKPNVCYTRPLTEEPKTSSFVEVDQVLPDNSRQRLFSGWMFAESPGLSGVEHAIYDVWLTGCRDPNAPPPVVEVPMEAAPADQAKDDEAPED
jgi:hypothetical protein